MSTLFLVLLIISMAATVITLFTGISGLFAQNAFYQRNSNKLMRMRVLFQGASVLFALLYMMSR